MAKSTTKKIIKKSPRMASSVRRSKQNNSMKKEIVFPLVVGIIFGAMVMMFWQFSVRLNTQNQRLTQLEQFANQNSQTLNDVVSFIQGNQGNQNQAPTGETPVE